MVSFGKKLETIRESRGITKTEMARMLDLSLPAYSLYEKGEREPKLSNLKRIADILNVTIDELLQDTNDDDVFEYAKRLWQKMGYKIEKVKNEKIIMTPPTNKLSSEKVELSKISFMTISNRMQKALNEYEFTKDSLLLMITAYTIGFDTVKMKE